MSLDILVRALGIRQRTNNSVTHEDTAALLLSFTRGINDYAKAMVFWPIQFYVTWSKWEDWKPEDVHAVALYLSSLASTKVINSIA